MRALGGEPVKQTIREIFFTLSILSTTGKVNLHCTILAMGATTIDDIQLQNSFPINRLILEEFINASL